MLPIDIISWDYGFVYLIMFYSKLFLVPESRIHGILTCDDSWMAVLAAFTRSVQALCRLINMILLDSCCKMFRRDVSISQVKDSLSALCRSHIYIYIYIFCRSYRINNNGSSCLYMYGRIHRRRTGPRSCSPSSLAVPAPSPSEVWQKARPAMASLRLERGWQTATLIALAVSMVSSTRSTRGTGSDLIGALPKKSMSTAPMHINCNTVAGRSLQLSPSRMEAQEVLVRLKLNPVDDIYAFQQQWWNRLMNSKIISLLITKLTVSC